MPEKRRTSFILLLEHVHTMEELTDEEFGQFIRAYAAYVENETEPDFTDRSMRMMWKTVKAFDEMNVQKYSSTSEARQQAGRKGAEKRWKSDSKAIDANSKNSKCHFANSKNSKCHFANSKNSLSVSESESESVYKEISPNGDIKKGANAPIPTPENKTARFHPPDMAEVKAYFTEKGGTTEQAQRFLDFYESNGWKVGKNPMKSWKAAASCWISRDKERQKAPAFQRNPVRYVSRPPEEAEKAGDFMRDAPDRTMKWLEKRKKEEENAPIQSDP